MDDLTVIAIDWSGAKGEGKHKGICLCAIDQNGETSRERWARKEVIDYVASLTGPLFVGLDFSFGLPAWFARKHDCSTIDDVWALAQREGDRWVDPPIAPFWDRKGAQPPEEQRFRRGEERMRDSRRGMPTSVFQLVGASQVGKGSVRGMPHLARLRAEGFAIWPFDSASERTVVEIYPSLLRNGSRHDTGEWTSTHLGDAVVSARVMWDERETVAALSAATDPTTRLEGDIWAPTPPQS